MSPLLVTFVTEPDPDFPSPYPPSAAPLALASIKKAQLCPILLHLSSVKPDIEHSSAAKTARDPVGHIFDPLESGKIYLFFRSCNGTFFSHERGYDIGSGSRYQTPLKGGSLNESLSHASVIEG